MPKPRIHLAARGGGLLVLLAGISLVALACMGGGRTAPVIPPPGAGGAPPPPASAGLLAVPVPSGDGWLLGPTPYVTAITPPHNSYQTMLPAEATARVDDHMGGGIEMYTALLDGAVVAGVTLGADGILHIPLPATAPPGAHWIQVVVRDFYGNLNEHGWAFFYQPGPPLMVEVGIDGARSDGLWVMLETFPAMAEAANPVNWSLIDPYTGLPLSVQVASVASLRQMPMLQVTLTGDVPAPPWILTLSWNGITESYGMGWIVLQGTLPVGAGGGGGAGPAPGGPAPMPGPGPVPGPGGGGAMPGGGNGDWWDLPGPMTPRDSCDCDPYPGPPLCPVDPNDRTPPLPDGPFIPPALCTDPNGCGGFPPPPPDGQPELYISAREISEEGDHPTWCAQLLSPRAVWYEHFLKNEIMLWDLDVTKDMSSAVWELEPNIALRSDDPTPPQGGGPHALHPGSPLQWNIAENQSQGQPWGIQYPLMHDWPRTGRTERHSRMYALPDPSHAGWPGEIHETSTPNITHTTGEEDHPDFQPDTPGMTPWVITGDERLGYVPSGNAYGTDYYKLAPPLDPAADLFVLVRGKDNPGVLAYEMPDSVFFEQGDRAPLTYARGDRDFLAEVLDLQSGTRVIDVLLEGGLSLLFEQYPDKYDEALKKVCDWGRVSATFMIDNGPAGSVPPVYQGKWSGNPGGDPDWSAIYEEAVWFVPVKKGVCCEEPETSWPIWVKLQDDQGNWRIASPTNWDAVVGPREAASLQAGGAGIAVTVNRPDWSKQYINLHPVSTHIDLPGSQTMHDLVVGRCPSLLASLTVGYEEDFQGADLVVQAHSGSVVCVEIEVGGGFFVNPLDWRLKLNDGDPSYQPPDGKWQNPGVECDFGRKDNPDETNLVDCKTQWQPQSPTCDEILLDDSLPNLTCDNRGPIGPFLGIARLDDLKGCPKDGSNCVVHMWYDLGEFAGDNFKFRGECFCKEATATQFVAKSNWTPAEGLALWRKTNLRSDIGPGSSQVWRSESGDMWQDGFYEVITEGTVSHLLGWLDHYCRDPFLSRPTQDMAHDTQVLNDFHTESEVSGNPNPVPPPHRYQEIVVFTLSIATVLGSSCGPTGVAAPPLDLHYAVGWDDILTKQGPYDIVNPGYFFRVIPAHELGHIVLDQADDPTTQCSAIEIEQTIMLRDCYEGGSLPPGQGVEQLAASEIIYTRETPSRE